LLLEIRHGFFARLQYRSWQQHRALEFGGKLLSDFGRNNSLPARFLPPELKKAPLCDGYHSSGEHL
jgi:hypothetical protein